MITTQPTGPRSSLSTGFNSGFLATAIVCPTLGLEQQTEVLMINGFCDHRQRPLSLDNSLIRKFSYMGRREH